ncbi:MULTISPECIES: SNF2-related protein [Dethiosulfovibrio]|uniref:SNF2-related protein n=2 Tax=Dethiosulfovibrio TaxID=47054 RepID=A0ABS9EMU9_9BACT|nr:MULTISPECIES: SNF2-related protein [Dethiosulfovibrio]MCF4113378.1 SNF2-related protein [Dethiosulfovibrio russensis]MCF4142485.1 SNF2-related protein [Dethiosulfovibrio marinus]MCF4145881.1 SNF2-related protein [Dethiosulfovibrio acidaminovorans]
MAEDAGGGVMMSSFQLVPDGVFFPKPMEKDTGKQDLSEALALSLLRELADNGSAEERGDGFLVSHEAVSALSSHEMTMLGLPDLFPFVVRIESEGDLQDSEFRFNWGFYVHYHGEKLPLGRCGSLLFQDENPAYTLPLNLFKLCEVLTEANAFDGPKDLAVNLRALKVIQDLAKEGGAELEPLLAETQVDVPEKLGIKLAREGEGISVAPELPEISIDSQRFERQVAKKPRDIYTESLPDGSRHRVIFSEAQKGELKKIKRHRYVSPEEKENFIDHPEEYFDPDLVDLDSFSDRVREIGCYKPKYYSFIMPYKSMWFGGLMTEDETGGQQKIVVKNEEDLDLLSTAIAQAVENSDERVTWGDFGIPLERAQDLYSRAEKCLRGDSKAQAVSKGDSAGKTRNDVLIIFENVETLDFAKTAPTSAGLEHIYEMPPNLGEGFSLLPHQQEGVAWLQQLSRFHDEASVGAMLADDMGLGKTLQILAFVEWHNAVRNTEGKPYLVVAPVALLENWKKEYIKFFPDGALGVNPLYGKRGSVLPPKDTEHNVPKLPKAIYLTTYETMRKRQRFFCAVDWAVTILDEAQKIKTPGTLVTNAAKALKAGVRIAATGTPVENTLVDLWCLSDFIMPGLLGSAKEFNKTYQRPLQDPDTDIRAIGEALQGKLGCFFKRRLKEDILDDLPSKYVEEFPRPMTPHQSQVYQETVDRLALARENNEKTQGIILKTLNKLRDISDHPYLVEMGEGFHKERPYPELIETSAKLEVTMEILRQIRDKGEKVILFALRRPIQELLQKILSEAFGLPMEHVSIINGSTPASPILAKRGEVSRQKAVDLFQSRPGFQAIVISPLAAGFGLNIAEANHVIHYSRHWNPAKEAQATDRAYRIGQKRDVYVYYPMATGQGFQSFDEILDERLRMKMDLAKGTLFPTERIEVNPTDLFEDLTKETSRTISSPRRVTEQNLDSMSQEFFEAMIAVIWTLQGYETHLISSKASRGADVLAVKDGEGYLFKAEQCEKSVGEPALIELLKGLGYYREQFGQGLAPCIVTNRGYPQEICELAAQNDVKLIDRQELQGLLDRYPVTWPDLHAKEDERF